MVDVEGKPLVVYHGTADDSTSFPRRIMAALKVESSSLLIKLRQIISLCRLQKQLVLTHESWLCI